MKKILVIDDEEWLREMVQLALSQKGYEVIEAGNGEEGIAKARQELPDLILCDVNMQKVDGYLTLSSLRSEPATAAIPFILMTGLADQAGMRHGMELGADDYLPKPFTVAALYAAVEARLKKVQTVRQEAEKKLADLRDNISLMLPHELRTPLNGILAYGEILATDAATLPASEVAEMGQVIHDSGKRLERLIENFLIYAQLELLGTDPQKLAALRKKQTEFPAKLVEKHAREQAQLARRPEDLVLELPDLAVPMSEEYLGKIVDELVQNAFKFSQPAPPGRAVLSDLAKGGAWLGKLKGVLHEFVHNLAEVLLGHRHGQVRQFKDQVLRPARQLRLLSRVFLDQVGGKLSLLLSQSGEFLGIGAQQFELRIDQKVLDQALETLARIMNDLSHFGHFAGGQGGGVGGEDFAVGQDAVERGAQLVRQHQADIVAQIGQFLLRLLPHRLHLLQPCLYRGIERVNREWFRQIIIGAQFHAVPHPGIVRQPGHQDKRDRGGGGLVAQRR